MENSDAQQTVNSRYAKLGYRFLMRNGFRLLLLPVLFAIGVELSRWSLSDLLALSQLAHRNCFSPVGYASAVVCAFTLYLLFRSRPVYLVDLACFCGPDENKASTARFKEHAIKCNIFDEGTLKFLFKLLERSGLGDETYLPICFADIPPTPTLAKAHEEAEMVIFGVLDELFAKTKVDPKDIGVLVVNCSVFCPTPSLSSMVVNKYKMSSSVQTFNLGGMGCSAGVIAIDLARNMLQVHGGSLAVVVSTENVTQNGYTGTDRTMLVANCLFRVGGSAVLLSNRWSDGWRAKYKLERTVRTHMAREDRSYRVVSMREDAAGKMGVFLSKEIMSVAGDALRANISKLGPLVLPISEQLLYAANLVTRKFLGMNKLKPYVPDFKMAFDHFCIHPGGRAVLDEMELHLRLSKWDMEPSRMTLYRFGNTSSSSVFYELMYLEAKGRVRKGDKVWQIALGSGFKCNSAVWRALRNIDGRSNLGPWRDSIDRMPADLSHLPRAFVRDTA